LAAIRATQPSTTLLRYTNGVLPISYIKPNTKENISHSSHIKESKTRFAILQMAMESTYFSDIFGN